jgi:hypothetical protein
MSMELLDYQRRDLDRQIESHTANLVRGTTSRDEDQRIRGIIYGLKLALGVIEGVEEKLRAAERSED